jgi:hypothetical protein
MRVRPSVPILPALDPIINIDRSRYAPDAVVSRMLARGAVLLGLAAIGALLFGVPASAQGRIVVADDVCRSLVLHQPEAGVEFVPGVDVRGREVAPADLPGRPDLEFMRESVIPLIIDLAGKYPDRLAGAELDLQLSLGALTINGDDVRLNGVPLNDPLERAIAALCAEQ